MTLRLGVNLPGPFYVRADGGLRRRLTYAHLRRVSVYTCRQVTEFPGPKAFNVSTIRKPLTSRHTRRAGEHHGELSNAHPRERCARSSP